MTDFELAAKSAVSIFLSSDETYNILFELDDNCKELNHIEYLPKFKNVTNLVNKTINPFIKDDKVSIFYLYRFDNKILVVRVKKSSFSDKLIHLAVIDGSDFKKKMIFDFDDCIPHLRSLLNQDDFMKYISKLNLFLELLFISDKYQLVNSLLK